MSFMVSRFKVSSVQSTLGNGYIGEPGFSESFRFPTLLKHSIMIGVIYIYLRYKIVVVT
jgi:hypothetical protein